MNDVSFIAIYTSIISLLVNLYIKPPFIYLFIHSLMSRCQDFCEVVNYLNGSGFMTLKSGGVKIEEKIKKKGGEYPYE